ncbi:hypothetical protein VOLCADRAFT_104828 [Volvox carteri f. nagariensis]|nr:uncharacterized protein VOLCADRAFT_104828 [Volvox carteri f. nagariensis]EFJ48342.1 hypothetical protein VOLCADRAFT_104828 [Volvox carteri f. nagariensis]|eukprot:XP_002950596.1 hypothetical protein VOLCADRAFT_104828 [Volvox carteri f. nagariensis]
MALICSKSTISASVASGRSFQTIVPLSAGARSLLFGLASWTRPPARTKHQVARATGPSPAVPPQYVVGGDGDPEMATFQNHQQSAPRPSAAAEARTVLDQGK